MHILRNQQKVSVKEMAAKASKTAVSNVDLSTALASSLN